MIFEEVACMNALKNRKLMGEIDYINHSFSKSLTWKKLTNTWAKIQKFGKQ